MPTSEESSFSPWVLQPGQPVFEPQRGLWTPGRSTPEICNGSGGLESPRLEDGDSVCVVLRKQRSPGVPRRGFSGYTRPRPALSGAKGTGVQSVIEGKRFLRSYRASIFKKKPEFFEKSISAEQVTGTYNEEGEMCGAILSRTRAISERSTDQISPFSKRTLEM